MGTNGNYMYSHVLLNDKDKFEKYALHNFLIVQTLIECTYTSLDGTAYYTPMPHDMLLSYKSVQHVIILNTLDHCSTMVFVHQRYI